MSKRRGFPLKAVIEIHREYLGDGELYSKHYLIGILPPNPERGLGLAICLGNLEKYKPALDMTDFYHPCIIKATTDGLTRFKRINDIQLAAQIALEAYLTGRPISELIEAYLKRLRQALPFLADDILKRLKTPTLYRG